MRKIPALILFTLLLLWGNHSFSQEDPILPDVANLAYGSHERNVLDIWIADSTRESPLAIYIHGGGFVSGSKDKLKPGVIRGLLEAGISVAAINYRFLVHAPLPAAHHDALRALQYIRAHAADWHIDKNRIAVFGNSAGAQLSMWLAFSDEMADPDSNDPIERESSRITCVATGGGQTTMDMELWREWVPEFEAYRTTEEEFYGKLSKRARKKRIKNISAISIVSRDDPPIFMFYYMAPDAAVPEKPRKAQGWKVHHVVFGIKLKEKMDKLGVESVLTYPGSASAYQSRLDFLKAKLLN